MMLFPACILTFRPKLRNLMDQIIAAPGPPDPPSGRKSEPRPLAPPLIIRKKVDVITIDYNKESVEPPPASPI